MAQAHIVGTGSSMPERVLSNKDMESIVDTTDEWITRRSGIKERRISSTVRDETTTDMATKASLDALKMAGISAEKLDMMAIGTVTADRQFPSAACMVQQELGATNAFAFDVSAGCAGFLYALAMVNNAVKCGMCQTALVVGVERLSSVVNWEDRSTAVLLADGAGAVVIQSKPDQGGILSTHLKSDGTAWDLLYSSYGNTFTPEILQGLDQKPFFLKMEGNKIFKRAINCLSDVSREALEHNGLSSDDIDLVVPHQANIRIIQGLASNLGIPMERVFTNIHKYGNTSSGTIPIALNEANREGRLKKGSHVLIVSFGAGLTWAAAILTWSM
jgi:3-oxoacyl-[acyl-carrier-protein] synthase-3